MKLIIKNGRYLVCFKKPETFNGKQLFGNDFLPATIEIINKRVFVKWDNGYTAKIEPKYLLFKSI